MFCPNKQSCFEPFICLDQRLKSLVVQTKIWINLERIQVLTEPLMITIFKHLPQRLMVHWCTKFGWKKCPTVHIYETKGGVCVLVCLLVFPFDYFNPHVDLSFNLKTDIWTKNMARQAHIFIQKVIPLHFVEGRGWGGERRQSETLDKSERIKDLGRHHKQTKQSYHKAISIDLHLKQKHNSTRETTCPRPQHQQHSIHPEERTQQVHHQHRYNTTDTHCCTGSPQSKPSVGSLALLVLQFHSRCGVPLSGDHSTLKHLDLLGKKGGIDTHKVLPSWLEAGDCVGDLIGRDAGLHEGSITVGTTFAFWHTPRLQLPVELHALPVGPRDCHRVHGGGL